MKRALWTRVLVVVVVLAISLAFVGCNKAPVKSDEKGEKKTSEETKATTYEGEAFDICLAHNLAVGSVLDQACNKFAEEVKERSGGKITVTVNPAAQLGNERDMLEGIQVGTVDIMLATTAYVSNIQPEFAVLDFPFIFDDLDHVKATLNGEVGDKLKTTLSDGHDLRILDYWNSGFRQMLTAKTKLENLESFNHLQIRAPEVPVYIAMFEALGANPTPIPFGDVYTSIQTGVVEGVECSNDQIYTMKFYEVGKYIALTNHIYTTVVPIVSNEYWDNLPEDAQKIINEAMAETTAWQWPAFEEGDQKSLDTMKESGIEVNDIDRKELQEACVKVYDELAEKNNCKDLLDMILAKE